MLSVERFHVKSCAAPVATERVRVYALRKGGDGKRALRSYDDTASSAKAAVSAM